MRATGRWRAGLAAVLVAVLAGCSPAGPAGSPPPALRSSVAERSSWPRAPARAATGRVVRVVDGDTVVVELGPVEERVRLIGVDTPESVAPGRPVERFGVEAASFTKRVLGGARVRLARDVEARDRYGRLLAYVWLEDGTFVNALLLAEGYAQQLTIPPNVTYAGLFRRLVREARGRGRGLWAAGGGQE